MRLDKFLCEKGFGTRKEVKQLLKTGVVTVNGCPQKDPSCHVNEYQDTICVSGKEVIYHKNSYLILHKPAGVVSARTDKVDPTVLELINGFNLDVMVRDLSPVGRLDKNTTGLLLLTDDGDLSHNLLSPRKHVAKEYAVELEHPVSEEDLLRLEKGIDIGENGEQEITLPAVCIKTGERQVHLIIAEGKYHQVKRMFAAIGNKVMKLHRLRMGSLSLPNDLSPGEARHLTEGELYSLRTGLPYIDDYEALIFDVDGTIADSIWVWSQIDIDYLAEYGFTPPEDMQRCIEGISFYQVALWFIDRFGIPDSPEHIMAKWNEMAEQKYREEVPLKEGVLDFLRQCKEKGIKIGIATSNSRELFTLLADNKGLTPYLDAVVTGNEIKKGKPDPDVYLACADKLGVSPDKCLVFEDIMSGILAGRRAGMKVCSVYDKYSENITREKQMLADYYLQDFSLLLNKTEE